MSYILDALKKIEHEKNKKRSDGRFNISADLFQERKRPTTRARIWKIVAFMVLASLVAAGGWFMFKEEKTTGSAVIRHSVPVPIPVPLQATAPPAQIPVQVPTPQVVSPVTIAIPAPQRSIEEDDDDESSARRARHQNKQGKTLPVAQKQRVQALQTAQPAQPAQTVQAPADIKLSGIAWQDERSGRRAVINGFLLKEGAVVAGVKITDIKSDKVRFSSPAGVFEIKLDAVVPAEVKK